MRIKTLKNIFLFLTKCDFYQMAINPYDWRKIDPSAVENGFTISFGKDSKIIDSSTDAEYLSYEMGYIIKTISYS